MASQESPLSILDGVQRSGDRRRNVRQKAHSPAYASFDVSEGGMAIRAGSSLAVNRTLNLVLDLSETKTYVNATGLVIWTGKDGVAGVRFSKMADGPRRHLKEWLLFNALTAAAKATRKTEGPATQSAKPEPVITQTAASPAEPTVEERVAVVPEAIAEPPLLTADAPTLNVIQEQVEALGSNVEAALALLVERSQALTRASGAAIALARGTQMVCRASSGDAPPVGTPLQSGSGFSGTCVRTAKLQRCDDAETDALVDRESCRNLGIRSMIAAPIITHGVVIGLLEVFSPAAYSFQEGDVIGLRRLSEIIGQAVSGSLDLTRGPETESAVSALRFSMRNRHFTGTEMALAAVAGLLFVAILVVLLTWIPRRGSNDVPAQVPQPSAAQLSTSAPAAATTLQELRKLAEQGDPVSQFALGRRYATGEEVKQDFGEAAKWFSKAADQGHVKSQGILGAYYMMGRGVPEDFNKAYFWSVLARAGGDEGSKYRVAFLTSRMSRAQVVEAQQTADNWLRDHQTTASR